MSTCPRCGGPLPAGNAVCAGCNPETIHPRGEVIPPEVPVEAEPVPEAKKRPFAAALVLAIVADLLQIVFFPLLMEGAQSPLDDLLDVAVGIAMVRMLGWHWAFLPSFLGKLVPILDEVPCWTLAVLFVRTQEAKANLQSTSVRNPG